MRVTVTKFPEVCVLQPRQIGDARGWFSEVWNVRDYVAAGIDAAFVQDNLAFSKEKDTVRGLHFQRAPHAQGKLVWVTRGAIFDVVVDIRKNSPTYGAYFSVVLNSLDRAQIWIPPGFAHGYCTLVGETEVLYKVTDYYAPDHEGGILWNDPDINIPWPCSPSAAIISSRDQALPRLREIQPFNSSERD